MIGTGHVCLVSGVCFSDFGNGGVGVDKLPEKIAMLERGEAPIYEPGLEAVMARHVAADAVGHAAPAEPKEALRTVAR